MDSSNLNISLKSIELENEGNKYICKIQLINEILNISLYLNNNILKYEGNITINKIQNQIRAFDEYNIDEIFEEINILNNNNFKIIKENNNEYKLRIKFIILRRKKYLYINLYNNNIDKIDLIKYILKLKEIIKNKNEKIKSLDNKLNKQNNKEIKNKYILRNSPPQVKNIPNVNVERNEERNLTFKKEKPEELRQVKKNTRSLSKTPINPLNKNSNSKDIIKKKEIKKIKENKEITPVNNGKIFKKIRDIVPYTHVGFDGKEPKENNQDNYFIFKNFADNKDYIYLSVCDGHGMEGHFVSEFIKEVLPYYMSENLIKRDILSETDKELIHQIITETFLLVNNMLISKENINSLFSGSTCVSVIYTPQRLIVPNIGDSRAVLGRFDKKTGKYKAIELSRDHKPTEKDEAKRIYENDGRIQPFIEDGEFVGPQRVWIKDEEVPGLVMTRSFGDRVAATVGVISEPEIKEFDFDENDKYMIIASHGIWEFISSQECIDIIQKYYESNDLKGCCENLYQESSKRWLKEKEVIDDTTLILVFFE